MYRRVSFFSSIAGLLALAAATVTLAGCGDPTGTGGHAQVVIFLEGDLEVARYIYPSQVVGVGLSVLAGADATYRIRLLDEDGRQVALDGQEFSLQTPLVVNATLATATIAAVDQIRVVGLLPGSTQLEFSLWHGGHEEFAVVGIPLVVHAP